MCLVVTFNSNISKCLKTFDMNEDRGRSSSTTAGRSRSPCASSFEEDASEAFEDARSELDKEQENSNKNEYDGENDIKVASPFRYNCPKIANAMIGNNSDSCDSPHLLKTKRSYSFNECEADLSDCQLSLPPLETFFDGLNFNGLDLAVNGCGSLATSLELENDILPSTPLTDEQLKHADSVLKDEMVQGVPINRIAEPAPLGNVNLLVFSIRSAKLGQKYLQCNRAISKYLGN